jgi:hypothetical protein
MFSVFIWRFPVKIFLNFYRMRATCPAQLILDLNYNNIWREIQIMELPIIQLSRASCHVIHFMSKYSP